MDYPYNYDDGNRDIKTLGFDFNNTAFFHEEHYDEDNLSLGGFVEGSSNWFRSAFRNAPNWEIIEPSLILATRLLGLKRCARFFHALLGDLRISKDDFVPNYRIFQHPQKRHEQYFEIKREEWDPDRIVPDDDLLASIRYLKAMMDHGILRFAFNPKVTTPETVQSDEIADFSKLARRDPTFFCNGYQSTIEFPLSTYENLATATHSFPADVPLILYQRFDFAVSLVHELAHAARSCLSGKYDSEPFFGHNPLAELGLELESHLFDGIIVNTKADLDSRSRINYRGRRSGIAGAIILAEYPDRRTPCLYKEPKIVIRDDGTPVPALDVAWRVPVKFFEKFFSEEWWRRPDGICTDIHPERLWGYCFRVEKTGHRIPVMSSIAETLYIPEEYHRDNRTGDILPNSVDALVKNRVRKRLLRDAQSTTLRPWMDPYGPGGEFESLSVKERRRREIVYSFGEELSSIQRGGKYALMDSNDSSSRSNSTGHAELLLNCVIDGLCRLPQKSGKHQLTREEAATALGNSTYDQRVFMVKKIAKNNYDLRSRGEDPSIDTDTDYEDDLDELDRDQLLFGTYTGNAFELARFCYNTGIAVSRYPAFGTNSRTFSEWELGFRPYSTFQANLSPIAPLSTVPQSQIRMDDLDVPPLLYLATPAPVIPQASSSSQQGEIEDQDDDTDMAG